MSFLFVDPMFVIMSVSERILCDSHVSSREVARQPGWGGAEPGPRQTATVPLRTLGLQIAFQEGNHFIKGNKSRNH